MTEHAGRQYDIVLFGATGFTGRLAARYLATAARAAEARWAVAGRSERRLSDLLRSLGEPAGVGAIVADAADGASLRAMARQCRVLATAAGPYASIGLELVAACVESSTHYVDITGEPNFVRESIDRHHAAAAASGVKVVHCCGLDCIPVDLAVMLAIEGLSGPPRTVRALCTRMNTWASGGSFDSAAEVLRWMRDPSNAARATDPYLLAPVAAASLRVDSKWTGKVGLGFDRAFGAVSVPYVMAFVDNRVVRRSLVLRGQAASYDEAMSAGAIARFCAFAACHAPSLLRRLRPRAGEGPSASVRRDGSFEFHVLARSADGQEHRVVVSGLGDPGYRATAAMLAESALCLALRGGRGDEEAASCSGGVLTPSVAMGSALVRRLEGTGLFTFRAPDGARRRCPCPRRRGGGHALLASP
ncbi:unnamed protein product [Prorocentrum cordatum]|uniref:Saccharopine dehydrogenase NADP binding domain-containing protein n=1 Tax=Prorocentrum cordatum TaxID=2364126 RepID=A0ABN9WVT3_9DINO|nr:unnamed protein product [Polarella glacialis]